MHEITREIPNAYFVRGYRAALLIRHGPLADYVAALDEAAQRVDELADNPESCVLVSIRGNGERIMFISSQLVQDTQVCARLLRSEFERAGI